MKNLAGQRFGRLIALERLPQKDKWNKCYLWRCRCDCGNTVDVPTSLLTSGDVKSCGCLRREAHMADISGQRFGRLLAVKPSGKLGASGTIWEFRCDCGNTCFATVNDVKWSGKASCGCLQHETKVRQALKMQEKTIRVEGTSVGNISNGTVSKNNTSGVRGVSWHQVLGKWQARIGFKGKAYHLGTYDKFEDAVAARKEAERRYFGEFLEWYNENYQESKE